MTDEPRSPVWIRNSLLCVGLCHLEVLQRWGLPGELSELQITHGGGPPTRGRGGCLPHAPFCFSFPLWANFRYSLSILRSALHGLPQSTSAQVRLMMLQCPRYIVLDFFFSLSLSSKTQLKNNFPKHILTENMLSGIPLPLPTP